MNRSLREHDYLTHMIGAIGRIQQYTAGKTAEDFRAEPLLQDGVIRNIEVLGEASRKLMESAPDATARFPDIPFAAIYAMRNQLSHGYFAIDVDVVWRVIQRDIPDLRAKLEAAIRSLPDADAS